MGEDMMCQFHGVLAPRALQWIFSECFNDQRSPRQFDCFFSGLFECLVNERQVFSSSSVTQPIVVSNDTEVSVRNMPDESLNKVKHRDC